MDKYYRVVFVYPDGHIEEIEENFTAGRDALDYGNNLIIQVQNTEGVFRGVSADDEDFGMKEKIDPYFMIIEVNGKKRRLVYDSRSNR